MKKSLNLPIKLSVKLNATIESLVLGNFDGMETEFLLTDLESKKNRIVFLARAICKKYDNYSIEAKFPMGFRDKKIEIAARRGCDIVLFKIIDDNTKLDKEVLYLDQIAVRIGESYPDMLVSLFFICNDVPSDRLMEESRKLATNNVFFAKASDLLDNDGIN